LLLNKINNSYLIIGILVYLLFAIIALGDYVSIYLFNVALFLYYFILINNISKQSENYFNSHNLISLVLINSFIVVLAYNILSYLFTSNFFVFSEADAAVYHLESLTMASKSFIESIKYFLNSWTFEDLGAALIISSLYRIIASNLFLNFFYIFCGVFTALGIFRISSIAMSKKYAFLAALTYSLSSFALWFSASGLKESFMVMLIVLFFDRYYLFISTYKSKDLIVAFAFAATLLLFRPALMFFCIGAVGVGTLFSRGIGINIIRTFLLIIISIAIISLYPLL